ESGRWAGSRRWSASASRWRSARSWPSCSPMRPASSPAPPGRSTAARFAPFATELALQARKPSEHAMTANKNYQWLLIALLSANFGIVFLDRQAFSFLGTFIQPDLQLTQAQIGDIAAAFSFAWAIAGLCMGTISD